MTHPERLEPELRRRLKESTRTLHDRVEATNFMSRLMRDDLTAVDYARTMRGLWAIYAPLEAQLRGIDGLREALPDLDQRFKSVSLENDLRDLAILDPDYVTPRLVIEPITSVGEALGTLYVMEGSTMGGRLIAAKLKARPFVKAGSLHFFEHYRAEAPKFWQRFTKCLEKVSTDQHDEVVAAARRTFEYFIALS